MIMCSVRHTTLLQIMCLLGIVATVTKGQNDSTNISTKCYEVTTQRGTFELARKLCRDKNMELARVDSVADEKILDCVIQKAKLRSFPESGVWIGLRRSTTNASAFEWQDGSAPSWTNWYEGQPSHSAEACVEKRARFGWRWNDIACNNYRKLKYFACYKVCKGIESASNCLRPTAQISDRNKIATASESTTREKTTATITTTTTTTRKQTTTETSSHKNAATTRNAQTTSFETESNQLLTNRSKHRATATTKKMQLITKQNHAEVYGALPVVRASIKDRQQTKTNLKQLITVETSTSASFSPHETREQVLGSKDQISLRVDTNESFSATVKTLQLVAELELVEGNENSGRSEVTREAPLGTLLEITPERHIENITVRFGVKVSVDEARQLLAGIKDKYNGRFQPHSVEHKCVYWDEDKARFSSFGMHVSEVCNDEVRCVSNHTTIFAVLLSVTGRVVPYQARVLTYLCEVVSILSLVLTLVVINRVRKRIRNERTIVQINLTVALLIFHVSNTFHDLALNDHGACEIVAVTLHFSILGSACWMLVEGVTLLLKTTDQAMRFTSHRKANLYKFLFGWGFPAILVLCSAVSGFAMHKYMEENELERFERCWVGSGDFLIPTVILPVTASITINLLILIRVGFFIYKMSKQTETFKPVAHRCGSGRCKLDTTHLRAALRAAALLLPIMSVPWLLFLLADAGVVFLYLTIVVNGLQGFFVFLVYCVFSKEVRNAALGAWNKTAVGKRISVTRNKPLKVNSTGSGDSGIGSTITHGGNGVITNTTGQSSVVNKSFQNELSCNEDFGEKDEVETHSNM